MPHVPRGRGFPRLVRTGGLVPLARRPGGRPRWGLISYAIATIQGKAGAGQRNRPGCGASMPGPERPGGQAPPFKVTNQTYEPGESSPGPPAPYRSYDRHGTQTRTALPNVEPSVTTDHVDQSGHRRSGPAWPGTVEGRQQR